MNRKSNQGKTKTVVTSTEKFLTSSYERARAADTSSMHFLGEKETQICYSSPRYMATGNINVMASGLADLDKLLQSLGE